MPSPPKPIPTTSARSSLSPEGPAGTKRDGRTPPPAPSAAYAKRAREIMESEGVPVVIQPELVEEQPVIGGYRRARAG